jgi:hypothetical protein
LLNFAPPCPTLRASAASVALLLGAVRWLEALVEEPPVERVEEVLGEKREELPQLELLLLELPAELGFELPLPHEEELPLLLRPLENELLRPLLKEEEELRPPPPKLPPLLAPRASTSAGTANASKRKRATRRSNDFIEVRG